MIHFTILVSIKFIYFCFKNDIKKDYTFSYPSTNLPDCSYKQHNKLRGKYFIDLSAPSIDYIEKIYTNINYGGHYYPKDCKVKQKVAILVPYKNREEHLRIFLHNIHKVLRRQYINYIIFLIEPINNATFNRGKLLNSGFLEATKLYTFDCVIFHDVDLIPQNDKHIYECSHQPRHMATSINKYDYTIKGHENFNGAYAFTIEHFKKINGFNNNYWGWGLEDVDLFHRIADNDLSISKYPKELSRFFMIRQRHLNSNNISSCGITIFNFIHKRFKKDGLSTLKYNFIEVEYHQLFTKIFVDLFEKSSKRQLLRLVLKEKLCGKNDIFRLFLTY